MVAASGGGHLHSPDHEIVLVELATAMAARPLDLKVLRSAMKKVEDVGGLGLSIEMAGVLGAFEAITKVADATGLKADSPLMLVIMRGVMTLMKNRTAILIGLIGVSIAAAFATSKLVRS